MASSNDFNVNESICQDQDELTKLIQSEKTNISTICILYNVVLVKDLHKEPNYPPIKYPDGYPISDTSRPILTSGMKILESWVDMDGIPIDYEFLVTEVHNEVIELLKEGKMHCRDETFANCPDVTNRVFAYLLELGQAACRYRHRHTNVS